MNKYNVKTAKPLINTINHQVKDPVRYPKVINGYESSMRGSFKKASDHLLVKLTEQMVKYKK